MKKILPISMPGLALIAFMNSASASYIPVGNFDFSDPAPSTYAPASNDVATPSILDWEFAPSGGGGVQTGLPAPYDTQNSAYLNLTSGTFTITYTGTGTPTGPATGTDQAIALPDIVAGENYVLTVALLNRNLTATTFDQLSLGTYIGSTFTAYATASFNDTDLASNVWTDKSVTLTSAETEALGGKRLGIQLSTVQPASDSFVQGNFADVRLVPEPHTWALMGFGGLVFLVGLNRMKYRT
jgi:hypothetical protein